MKSERLIYSLCCPVTEEVHYIGKSTSGMMRPMQHLSGSHSEKIKQWVSDLKELNHSPKIKVVEYILPFEDIDLRERYWIQYYMDNGSLLLNESLITPLVINPNLDQILDGTYGLKDGDDVEILKISRFIKEKRKMVNLTQEEFADKTGIALTVLRKIEQGKTNITLSGLLEILYMFGCTLGVIRKTENK
jgi:DNA-binding XRE family transcriptional regulator